MKLTLLCAHKQVVSAPERFVEVKYVIQPNIIHRSYTLCGQYEYPVCSHIKQSLTRYTLNSSGNIKGDHLVSPFIFGNIKCIVTTRNGPRQILFVGDLRTPDTDRNLTI